MKTELSRPINTSPTDDLKNIPKLIQSLTQLWNLFNKLKQLVENLVKQVASINNQISTNFFNLTSGYLPYFNGSTLQDSPVSYDGSVVNLSACNDAGTDTDKFLVLDATNNVDYRTGAEVLSDIGAASASHGVTTNYIPYASGATTWGTSSMSINSNSISILKGSDDDGILNIYGANTSTEFLSLGIQSGYAVITAGGAITTNCGLSFKTADTGTEAERMVITNDGKVGVGEAAPDRRLHASVEDTSTNTTTYVGRFTHLTSGSATAGIGAGIEFEVEDLYSNLNVVTTIEGVDQSPTSGNSQGEMVFKTYDEAGTGLAERVRIKYDGTINIQTCADAGVDTDKFLVLDSNKNIDYRTGAEVLSDIEGASAAHGVTTNYIPYATSTTLWGTTPVLYSGGYVDIDQSLRVDGSLITNTYALGIAAPLTTGKIASCASSVIASIHSYYDNSCIEIVVGTSSTYKTGIVLGARSFTGTDADAIGFYVRGSEFVKLTSSGYVGIRTITPKTYLDVSASTTSIFLGADTGGTTTRTNNTAKTGAIAAVQYDNSEEGTCVLYVNNAVGGNTIAIGGGFAERNAVTGIAFYAAANTTTLTGTIQFLIDSSSVQAYSPLFLYSVKSGADQATAGAAAGEVFYNTTVGALDLGT